MLVGVPKEIKNHEYRVRLVPSSVRELVHHGHKVMVETNAGAGIGFTDEDDRAAGADIGPDAGSHFATAENTVMLKVPQQSEGRPEGNPGEKEVVITWRTRWGRYDEKKQ